MHYCYDSLRVFHIVYVTSTHLKPQGFCILADLNMSLFG